MSNITVCARFRPLTSKEKQSGDDSVCVRCIDAETFIFKDEKDEELEFSFDRVFYEKSEQADIYQFLALPIVRDAVNAINGTIITYGQTGAGKTYSMEGPSIQERDEHKKGLLPRVVEGLFHFLRTSDEDMTYSVELSMVEIYMEKVRDLFDLSKDNIKIKESKLEGIILPAVTKTTVLDPTEALQALSRGIANRAVGETQMNVSSSRSHCIYIFNIKQVFSREKRTRFGKLILVDLAGSEKVEKTGAEGRVLDEAKTINKSLSALGNVVNSLTCGLQGKASHVPYRDSKLTRILQDALGGSARTALLCCCSPSAFNASESLSTLRFGARAKHIKASPRPNCYEEKRDSGSSASFPPPRVNGNEDKCDSGSIASSPPTDESSARILDKLRERLNVEDVKLLEELFIQEGILFDPSSVEEELEIEDLTLQTISSLQEALEKLTVTVDELKRENSILRAKVDASTTTKSLSYKEAMISGILSFFSS
ncbi:kinesin-like protein KIN-1 [Lotus japonicus]|uniref:kinesin-like protein KIN-1 n=1 Tax=Lotus japonicus TaxID=34305 RepID=UPI002590F6B1|nr:kinesin-like protein KIN-1 [Lotus japonicus]